MPHTPRSRIVSLAAGTAAATGIGMIPAHRLPHSVQIGYVVLPAAVGAGVIFAAVRRAASGTTEADEQAEAGDTTEAIEREPRRGGMPSAFEITFPLVAAGIIAGSGVASLRIDRGVEGLLRRRGVPAPRVVMGLASGALSLAMAAFETRVPDQPEELTSPPSAR